MSGQCPAIILRALKIITRARLLFAPGELDRFRVSIMHIRRQRPKKINRELATIIITKRTATTIVHRAVPKVQARSTKIVLLPPLRRRRHRTIVVKHARARRVNLFIYNTRARARLYRLTHNVYRARKAYKFYSRAPTQ